MLQTFSAPTDEIIHLLENSTIGTPGKSVTYRLSDVRNKIRHIISPVFATLQKQGRVIGSCCFCHRTASLQGQSIDSSYFRYFVFSRAYQRGNNGLGLKKRIVESALKRKVKDLLESTLASSSQKKHFFYAYLDPDNLRSKALCNYFGFEPVRAFSTVVYSRHKPKIDSRVGKYFPHERLYIEKRLKEFYHQYSMFSLENVFFNDSFYVLRDRNDHIVAGVQANLVCWQIRDFPGFFGKVLVHLFPYIPYINRYISKNFNYVSFEAVFYEKGQERELEKLFDSVLAIHRRHTAIMWMDVVSDLYRDVKKLNTGFFGKLFKGKRANVIIKTKGILPAEKQELKAKPAYISAFDLT